MSKLQVQINVTTYSQEEQVNQYLECFTTIFSVGVGGDRQMFPEIVRTLTEVIELADSYGRTER